MERIAAVALGLVIASTFAASAQVRYQPYPSPRAEPVAPTPYGYPVPYGFVQPDEALGTSPSYVIGAVPFSGAPTVSVVQRCQYPDGWNVTDFSRDVNGIPNGSDHICPVPPRVRARY